jgi:hypothetical protein
LPNTLFYYDTAKITAVLSFIVQAPGWKALPRTNTQAYCTPLSVPKKKKFKALRPARLSVNVEVSGVALHPVRQV